MRQTALVITLCVSAIAIAAAGGQGESAPQVAQADGYQRAQAAGVDVQWRVDGDTLSVRMTAATTGWVAVGFDPTRMMADANMIIAYVENGELRIADDVGTSATSHGRDTANGGRDDIIRSSGTESDGVTQVSFAIPLDSGDPTDRPLRPGSTYRVIVAHGPNGADNFDAYHAARGSFEMEL